MKLGEYFYKHCRWPSLARLLALGKKGNTCASLKCQTICLRHWKQNLVITAHSSHVVFKKTYVF